MRGPDYMDSPPLTRKKVVFTVSAKDEETVDSLIVAVMSALRDEGLNIRFVQSWRDDLEEGAVMPGPNDDAGPARGTDYPKHAAEPLPEDAPVRGENPPPPVHPILKAEQEQTERGNG